MNIKLISAIIAVCGLIGVAACGDGTGGGGAGGDTGGTGGTGGVGGTGGIGGTGGTGGTVVSCYSCACDFLLSESGCKDKCDKDFNGNPGTPNFCDGVSALPQCAACIASACLESDPLNCGQ